MTCEMKLNHVYVVIAYAQNEKAKSIDSLSLFLVQGFLGANLKHFALLSQFVPEGTHLSTDTFFSEMYSRHLRAFDQFDWM